MHVAPLHAALHAPDHAPAAPGHAPAGPQCTATQLLAWAGLHGAGGPATDAVRFALRHVRAEAPLVHEGQPFEALYLVCSGSFKCVQTDVEGYEQVLEFAIHGDLLGLDGLGRADHASGAVALEDAAVAVIPWREFADASRRVPALASLLLSATGNEVRRRGETQYLMAAPRSEVRVARFLLQLAQRQAAIGYSDRRLRLCMTRRDIASHLGVAHETVSRALGALAECGCIRVSNREIELTDLDALHEVQRMTRGRLGARPGAGARRDDPAMQAAPARGPGTRPQATATARATPILAMSLPEPLAA